MPYYLGQCFALRLFNRLRLLEHERVALLLAPTGVLHRPSAGTHSDYFALSWLGAYGGDSCCVAEPQRGSDRPAQGNVLRR